MPETAPAPALDEAVLAEVRSVVTPATEQVSQLRLLLAEFVQRLKAERRERVEDLELMTELMTEGWKNVDRRLGRIEKVVSRLEEAQSSAPAAGRAAPSSASRIGSGSRSASPRRTSARRTPSPKLG